MSEISRFFGIIIRMFYDEHDPPHFHGNILKGSLESRIATRLVCEWIDLHATELDAAWQTARNDKEIFEIEPLR